MSRLPSAFHFDVGNLAWRLAAQEGETFHDPIKDAVQKALRSSCSVVGLTEGHTWTGSGFHFGEGMIATAAHVVPRDEELGYDYDIAVTFDGRQSMNARVIASNPDDDCAILFCKEAAKFPRVEIADSNSVEVGDLIAVISSPEGFHDTASFGRVSNVHQAVPDAGAAWNDLIFIDAKIMEGSSGGMCINFQGKVIGMVEGVAGVNSGISVGENSLCPSNKLLTLIAKVQ